MCVSRSCLPSREAKIQKCMNTLTGLDAAGRLMTVAAFKLYQLLAFKQYIYIFFQFNFIVHFLPLHAQVTCRTESLSSALNFLLHFCV